MSGTLKLKNHRKAYEIFNLLNLAPTSALVERSADSHPAFFAGPHVRSLFHKIYNIFHVQIPRENNDKEKQTAD